MSRQAGQLRTRHSLLGLGGMIGVCGGIIALCGWLLLPAEQLPSLETPAQAEFDVPPERACGRRVRAARERSATPRVLVVDSSSLIACPDSFDGRTVQFTGEAVGAVLTRGDRAWAQLNDDPYALSLGPLPEHRQSVGGNAGVAVNLPAAAARAITSVGGAQRRGDVMTVTGVFRSAARDDGEGPGILVDAVRDLRPGGPVTAPRSTRRTVVAMVLAVITLGVAWRRRRDA